MNCNIFVLSTKPLCETMHCKVIQRDEARLPVYAVLMTQLQRENCSDLKVSEGPATGPAIGSAMGKDEE